MIETLSPESRLKKRLMPLANVPEDSLLLHEIYASIQGESTYAGLACVFVRTTVCNLRCSYCDTRHAFTEGKLWTLEKVYACIKAFGLPLVELTGGEPLLQANTLPLMQRLCDEGYTVLLETSGSLPISEVDSRVVKILDLKTPTSREESSNLYENIEYLNKHDEVKFVIGSREDYLWAKDILKKYQLSRRAKILMGPVFNAIAPKDLAEWILEDKLSVRLQVQLHKVIWSPNARGV